MKSSLALTLAVLGAVAACAPSLSAQEAASAPEPKELATLRRQYHGALEKARAPVHTAYIRTLQSMISQRESAKDVAGARELEQEIVNVKGGIAAAAAGPEATGPAAPGVVILSATYWNVSRTRSVDTTDIVRKAFNSGLSALQMNTREGAGGLDPARTERKETVISYYFQGQVKEKVFAEAARLHFARDLN